MSTQSGQYQGWTVDDIPPYWLMEREMAEGTTGKWWEGPLLGCMAVVTMLKRVSKA